MRRRAEAPSTRVLRVRLSPAEDAIVQKAAKVNHQNLSEFLRDAWVTAAHDCLELPSNGRILRIIQPS